jgi:hypothetical protein
MLLTIRTRNLFATPIAMVDTPDHGPRNAALRDIILERRRTTPTLDASNDGAWHSDRQLLNWGGPHVADIVEMAQGVANHLTRERTGQQTRFDWNFIGWANVNGPGDGNVCHYHPGNFWSGHVLRGRRRHHRRPFPGRQFRNARPPRHGARHIRPQPGLRL